MFQNASQREFDVVLFWSLDRFSREGVWETLNHRQGLTDYGINSRSFAEQYLDSYASSGMLSSGFWPPSQSRNGSGCPNARWADSRRARKEGRVGGRPRVVVDRLKVDRLSKVGKSLTEIAQALRTSKSSVTSYVTRARPTSSIRVLSY
jgi:DNA invertase Pin-like site-specific DNA recombinase